MVQVWLSEDKRVILCDTYAKRKIVSRAMMSEGWSIVPPGRIARAALMPSQWTMKIML